MKLYYCDLDNKEVESISDAFTHSLRKHGKRGHSDQYDFFFDHFKKTEELKTLEEAKKPSSASREAIREIS